MQRNKIRKTDNLFVLESAVSNEVGVPLKRSLMSVLGGKYEGAIDAFLVNITKQDLLHITLSDIKSSGFTEATAKKMMAVIQFALTLYKLPSQKKSKISSPEAAYRELEYLKFETQENFVVLFLNTKNEVIGRKTIFLGSLNASIVHPREIMREAVKLSSASMILCHNHPSGDTSPSTEDLEVTERLVDAGNIVGIEVIDHIIVGDNKYISLKEKGYM